jgi:hypothetical protein
MNTLRGESSGQKGYKLVLSEIPPGTLMSDKPRLFISYARADDEPFVKRLYHDLKNAGFDVWWDRVSMPNRS